MRYQARRLIVIFAAVLLAACTTVGPPAGQTAQSNPGTPTAQTKITAANTPSPVPTDSASLDIGALTGRIAYSHEGDIYTMNADGSQVTRLTTDPAMDFDPAWSPDGTQIAFRSHRDGNEEVYLMNADGSGQHNLTNASGGDYSPAWSPDGQWIAFMSDREGNPNIWLVRPDGSDVHQVTEIPGISEYPSWSPDSSRIAFHCTFGRVLPGGTGDFEICVVNADGTQLVQLTDAAGESKLPTWSPDGAAIAFQSNRGGWPTIPDYTPPGYDPERFGDYEIYRMNADGSELQNLTNHPREDDSFPAWSRGGTLTFSRYGCLMVMNPDGSGVSQISEGSCAGTDSGEFPDWYQAAK